MSGVGVMRFDFASLRQAVSDKLSQYLSGNLSTALAVGGMSLAVLMVGYVVLFLGGQSVAETEARTMTVAVVGPVFKPVVATPSIVARDDAPSPRARAVADHMPQAQDERSLTRAVQTALKNAGCYGGRVNGRWSPQTSAAMDEFTMRVNARLPIDRPDPVLLALLETHDDVSCAKEPGDAPARTIETASTVPQQPVVTREASLSTTSTAPSGQTSETTRGWHRPEGETGRAITASVNADETVAAGDVVSVPVVRVPKRAMKRDRPRRASRKYRRKPSFSREVRRSFRSIQRSMRGLF